jgi:hypothetical protein
MYRKIIVILLKTYLYFVSFLKLKRRNTSDKLFYILGLSQIFNSQKNYNNIKFLHQSEVKIFSQNGEDGIIDYIISRLGILIPNFIEIGVGDYRESNTRFIYCRYQPKGLIIDSENELKKKVLMHLREKSSFLTLWKGELTILNTHVESENINLILSENCKFEVDIFSLDIDSIDYWVLSQLKPNLSKIFVVEYNSVFGPDLEITIPNLKNFIRKEYHYSCLCYGMSLKALIKLMDTKNYYFIGSNSLKNNAFFVSKDYSKDVYFPNLEVKDLKFYTDSNLQESRDRNGVLNYLKGKDKLIEIQDCKVINLKNNTLCSIRDLL